MPGAGQPSVSDASPFLRVAYPYCGFAFWTLVIGWAALSFWPEAPAPLSYFAELGRIAVAALEAARADRVSFWSFLAIWGFIVPGIAHPSWVMWRQMRDL